MLRTSKWILASLAAGLIGLTASTVVRAQDADANAAATAPAEAPAKDAPAPSDEAAPKAEAKDAASAPTEAAPAETPKAAEPTDVAGKKAAELWTDLLQYVRVARPDLVKSYAQALVDTASAEELYALSIRTPDAMSELGKAARQKDLAVVITKLMQKIEDGAKALRANPDQIENWIKMLAGPSPKGFQIASERLRESGEYCLVQLVQKLRSAETPETTKDRIVAFLPTLGLQAVRPLSEALQSSDSLLVERVSEVLGQIGYPTAGPMLKEVLQRPNLLPRTSKAVQTALLACAGKDSGGGKLSDMYYKLAAKYYYGDQSVLSDPRFESANVWYWKDDLGLTYKPVPRAIFCDVYAMRYARLALQADAGNREAVAMWIAADFRREAALPAGAADPIRSADEPRAEFYALVSGPSFLQDVLSRGLRDESVPVIVGAIGALARTAGAASLVKSAGDESQPLVKAMGYSDGRVRFLAAVTLAAALPQEKFPGADSVIPVLNDALRMGGGKRVMLVCDNSDLAKRLKGLVRAAGMEAAEAADAAKAVAAIRGGVGADLAVVAAKADTAAISALRREPALKNLPVIVIGKDSADLREAMAKDKQIVSLSASAEDEAIASALAKVAKGEGMTPEEAAKWAVQAAGAIRMLATTGNRVFDVNSTIGSLVALMKDAHPEVRTAAAAALAVMPDAAAQQAVAANALAEAGEEKDRIVAFKVAAESVRRFGNKLSDAQVKAVLEIASGKGSLELRDAAAQLSGSMNLPSEKIKSLILNAGAAGQ